MALGVVSFTSRELQDNELAQGRTQITVYGSMSHTTFTIPLGLAEVVFSVRYLYPIITSLIQ